MKSKNVSIFRILGVVLPIVAVGYYFSPWMLIRDKDGKFRPAYIVLRASGRSKLARVRSDMRSLAIALEAYYIDNGEYPAWSNDPSLSAVGRFYDGVENPSQPWDTPTFRMRHTSQLCTLTTPTAYISPLFSDPFSSTRGRSFHYYTSTSGNKYGWILYSPGPDGDIDIQLEDYEVSIPQPSNLLLLLSYDSTNGTVSDGDVWRVKQ